jgi:hypothetical protein
MRGDTTTTTTPPNLSRLSLPWIQPTSLWFPPKMKDLLSGNVRQLESDLEAALSVAKVRYWVTFVDVRVYLRTSSLSYNGPPPPRCLLRVVQGQVVLSLPSAAALVSDSEPRTGSMGAGATGDLGLISPATSGGWTGYGAGRACVCVGGGAYWRS